MRLGWLRRRVLASIAICFSASALGLGARHGCPAGRTAAERLVHVHDGGHKGGHRTPPAAHCDCIGHACCLAAAAAPPPPGLAVLGHEQVDRAGIGRPQLPTSQPPHLLPYATAPPYLLTV